MCPCQITAHTTHTINAIDCKFSFLSTWFIKHENTSNKTFRALHETWRVILFHYPRSVKFFWIGPSVLTVQGTTRGNFLSGLAACFWNNDLDKNSNNNAFDSLTAKSLSLVWGHSTLQLSLSETKVWKQLVATVTVCIKENGNMTSCVKHYYLLYFLLTIVLFHTICCFSVAFPVSCPLCGSLLQHMPKKMWMQENRIHSCSCRETRLREVINWCGIWALRNNRL